MLFSPFKSVMFSRWYHPRRHISPRKCYFHHSNQSCLVDDLIWGDTLLVKGLMILSTSDTYRVLDKLKLSIPVTIYLTLLPIWIRLIQHTHLLDLYHYGFTCLFWFQNTLVRLWRFSYLLKFYNLRYFQKLCMTIHLFIYPC